MGVLLADYRNGVRDILHDPNANFYSVASVDRWINRGRKKVAEKGRCVRRLSPSSGSVSSIMVTGSGSGYVSAACAISAPDSSALGNVQATATVNLAAGAVTGFTMTNVGAGYVAPPTVTVTGTGTGGAGSAVLSAHVNTVPNQEVYTLAAIASTMDTLTPGLGELIGVQSVSVAWGALKPTLAKRSFSELQAYFRVGSMAYTSNPRVWAPYGQGVTGSYYLWPIPYQYAGMEVDCYFSVLDLSDSQAVDLIPTPWNEPAFYYAAYLAYLNAQRTDDARTMLGEHERLMTEARGVVTTDDTPDPYGEP